jgi:2-polyprenyl-3-methyl-5-hydroxy-6-metoxy-1,4-benzoquinol methylase
MKTKEPNKALAHDDWDAHWDQYAASASQNPAQNMRHSIVAKLMVDENRGIGRKILDIGSGQGDLIQKLAPLLPNAEFYGVELSKSGVEISRQKTKNAKFLIADLSQPNTAIPELNSWATDAVCSEVLEHLDDPLGFLKNIKKYLSFGGKLIVTVPGGPMSAFDLAIGHRRHFTKKSVGEILEGAGFTVEAIRLAGFPFFNLYRLVVIARGEKLARDVSSGETGSYSKTAEFAMRVFQILFRFTLGNSPLGWQVIAVARNTAP